MFQAAIFPYRYVKIKQRYEAILRIFILKTVKTEVSPSFSHHRNRGICTQLRFRDRFTKVPIVKETTMKKTLLSTLAIALLLASPACRQSVTPTDPTADSISIPAKSFVVEGLLVIGHEVSSFTADGDTLMYWVTDTTGMLQKRYYQTVGEGAQPYTPVRASLQVVDCGKATDGFAAEYDGLYRVEQVIDIAPLDLNEKL